MTQPQVVSAASASNTSVTVTFDQNINADAVLRNRHSYFIDGGLFVEAVVVTSATVVTLTTSKQVGSRAYKVTVSSGVRSTPGLEYLNPSRSSAAFTGTTGDADYVVSDLEARTWPGGAQIDLFWTNPTSPVTTLTKIVRRQHSYPLNDTDDGTVVYNGAALTSAADVPKHSDTGLVAGKFYYYLVLVKHAGSVSWEVTSDSRVSGFASSGALDSRGFISRMVPANYLTRDEEAPGSGTLGKILDLLGGFTDQMRSVMNSIRASIDDEEKPYELVKWESRAMGFEPEGEQYDFEIPRRVLLQLQQLWARRGTTVGLIQAVNALTKWDCTLTEYGIEGRSRSFGMWDSDVSEETRTMAPAGSIAFSLTDGAAAWAVNAWVNGRVLDSMGNWLDVLSNTATVLTYKALSASGTIYRTTLAANVAINATTATLTSVYGLLVGQRVQLYDSATANAQVVEITAINPATKVITFWNRALVAFTSATGTAGWEIIKAESSMTGTVPGAEPAGEITVATPGGVMLWLYGQWIGYYFRDSGGTNHLITGSDATKIYYNAAEGVIPVGDVIIAKSFSGANPQLTYTVIETGYRPTMFDPRFDWELRGTRLDPFFYFSGALLPLMGDYGPCDVGVYITTTGITDVLSRPSSVSGGVLTDASASFTVNALAGKYLNPNQNQTRMVKILSNTATTITVGEDISGTVVAGVPYYVMTERNKLRFERLNKRLPEFLPGEVKARVLFL